MGKGFFGRLFGGGSGGEKVAQKRRDDGTPGAFATCREDDLITEDNLSTELLKRIMDDAGETYKVDSDGDLVVQGKLIKVLVIMDKSKKRVNLFSQWGFKDSASQAAKLEMVNRINQNVLLVTASMAGNNDDALRFEHDLSLEGGITRQNLVRTLRRFMDIPPMAILKYGAELVE